MQEGLFEIVNRSVSAYVRQTSVVHKHVFGGRGNVRVSPSLLLCARRGCMRVTAIATYHQVIATLRTGIRVQVDRLMNSLPDLTLRPWKILV